MHCTRAIALLAGVLLVSCRPAAGGPPDAALSLAVLDPLAKENACGYVQGHAQRDYGALGTWLSVKVGRPVKVVYDSTLASARAQIGRDPDLAIGVWSRVEHESREAGRPMRPLALLTDGSGSTTFQGLFVVRAADRARTIADLKGRAILFGPEWCEEKHAAALALLRSAGITPPRPPQIEETCTAAAVRVVEGEVDAAVVSSYALPLLVGCEAIAAGELRVVARTAPVPFVAAFGDAGMPGDLAARVQRALLAVGKEKALLAKLESKSGFVAVPAPAARK